MAERIVFIHLPGQRKAVPAGRLTLLERGIELQGSRFGYGRRYLERVDALPADPVSLSLADGRRSAELLPVNSLSLFGALRDATPDAWGRRVIENRLRAPPNGLAESVYLDMAGPHRAGALDVREHSDSTAFKSPLPAAVDLQYLLDAAERVEAGEPVPAHLDVFFAGGPTLGGARPKAVLQADGVEWIAKFPSRHDRMDMPRIEQATLELARAAGLQVPRTRLAILADGRAILLVERFDRQFESADSSRLHMVSALTMLGLHESASPDASYADIAQVIGSMGASQHIATDRIELYARMVFNILVSNDDDHLRNHAFLCSSGADGWRLSPLYDVVPKPQLASERFLHLSVGPMGRSARLDNALAGAGRFGLLPPVAFQIIQRVVAVVREWRGQFEALGVPDLQNAKVASAFVQAKEIGMNATR